MTIKEYLSKALEDRGMFPHQAVEVVAGVVEATTEMAGRWDDDTEGYPPQMLAVLWYSVDRAALKWIDENLPKAWFRPMFVKEPQLSKEGKA